MDAFKLAGSDDDVRDASTIGEDEDCAVTSGVVVSVAVSTAVEFLVAEILGAGDCRWRAQRDDAATASRDVQGLSAAQSEEGCEEGN